jgi:8-oxo-dGTP pyrophosphatase MutT (NUDIX family)
MESPINRIIADDSCNATSVAGMNRQGWCVVREERRAMRDRHFEPQQASLEEMLTDPIVWTLMKSDGVEEHQLRALLKRVAEELVAGDAKMSVTKAAIEFSPDYRRGVGIMLLNKNNEVLVGRRADAKGAWQMPQGGIDENEDPLNAALRELREEIGTDKAEVIAESKAWLRYDLPPELRKRWGDRWRGQQQKWFVMRFMGMDADIDVATEHPEFSGWKWVAIERLPDLVVSFKRQLYVDLLRELAEAGTIVSLCPPKTSDQ